MEEIGGEVICGAPMTSMVKAKVKMKEDTMDLEMCTAHKRLHSAHLDDCRVY